MKAHNLFLLFAFFVTTGLFACSHQSSPDDQIRQYSFPTATEGKFFFNNAKITCSPDSKSCPEFSGAMLAYTAEESALGLFDSSEIAVCSLTLISGDRVLTNRHCLPKDLRFAGADCSGRIVSVFPERQGKLQHKVGCASIEAISGTYSVGNNEIPPDWAILRLQATVDRTPVKSSPSSIAHGTPIEMFPVYFNLDQGLRAVTGEIKKINCKSSMLVEDNRKYFRPDGYSVALAHCSDKVILGNSGTGLLNSNRQLIGLLSHAKNQNNLEAHNSNGEIVKLEQKAAAGNLLNCNPNFNPNLAPVACRWLQNGEKNRAIENDIVELNRALLSPAFSNLVDQIEENLKSDQKIQWKRKSDWYLETISLDLLEEKYFPQSDVRDQNFLQLYREKYHSKLFPFSPECVRSQKEIVESELPTIGFNQPKITPQSEVIYSVYEKSFPVEMQKIDSENYVMVFAPSLPFSPTSIDKQSLKFLLDGTMESIIPACED